MKHLISQFMFCAAVLALTSCGGGSSEGMFGNIPQTIEKYEQESDAMKAGMDQSNYQDKLANAEELKTETIAELEKEGEALNGKELKVAVDENDLKIETPLTLVYKNVFSNVKAVEFGLDGKIIAAQDLKLEINPSDLKGRDLFGGKSTIVTAKLPVHIEFYDSEGNVIDTRTIGNLVADNNGEEAIIKAGTPVDFEICSLPVTAKFVNVVTAGVVVDVTKGLTSEKLPD